MTIEYMRPLDSVKRIEDAMASVMTDWPLYSEYLATCKRLLETMGNADGDEIFALAAVAFAELMEDVKQ